MTHAIRIRAHGGPEALRRDAVDVPSPAAGEAVIRHTAIGVNCIDVYHRRSPAGGARGRPRRIATWKGGGPRDHSC
jgi:NADPH:quinone reductase-like Zn-dependent oxidoreductase